MNLPAVVSTQSLVVRQQKEFTEIFTDFETKNQYAIQLPNGHTVLHAAETGGGAMAFLARNFLKASRPFHMSLRDASGASALELDRPWRWLFSRLEVADGGGRPLGAIQQRFAFLAKKFSILDAGGAEIASLHGPLLRPWTFRVLVQGQEVGTISKKFGGILREAFTDADTFGLELSPAMEPALRVMALAATFLIDFLYFEDRD